MNERLARLAKIAGIEPDYWDALGSHRELTEATAKAVLSALGFDPDGDVDSAGSQSESAAAAPPPRHCFIPEALRNGGRIWGLAIQLYALRSARNWGIGDFTDLASFARIAAAHGAALVGLNPLHARHLACPGEASPYSPSSRVLLDPMTIDVEAVPDFSRSSECRTLVGQSEFRVRLDAARAASHVDHEAVCALKLAALERAYDAFDTNHRDPGDSRRRHFDAFIAQGGETLERFAEFEALRLGRAAQGQPVTDWPTWPAEWRDPGSAAMREFRITSQRAIRFQMYLQWEAQRQLDAAAATARSAGVQFAFYRDLAVGAAFDSAEAWGDRDLIATAMRIGAPPDQFSENGQNWGLPPWNPRALAARRYEPFAAMLSANMRGAGALRIDHVMSLMRLFWIPEGMPGTQGAYVRYPFDALADVVGDQSNRHRCMIIGEDLGSVPDGFRERLHARGFLSYRVLLFERHWSGDGSLKRPGEYPRQALATVVTHDMPTIADFWTFGDIARRVRLGLIADDAQREQETARRHDERWKVLALLHDLGLVPLDPENTDEIAAALHAAVARTPSMIAIVQLDDVLGEIEPANIPGTHREYPNWRRKLSRTLDEIAADPRLERLADSMREAGRAA